MIIDRLRHKLEAEIKARAEMLISGQCNDYLQYRVTCAEIRAMEDAIALMKDYYVEDEIEE